MDLSFSPEEIAFRDEVRAFLAENLPQDLRAKVRGTGSLTKADMDRWHAILQNRGWLAQNWPKDFGGAAWNAVQRHISEEEAARADAPRIVPFGLSMLAPVLQKFGSKAQQDYYRNQQQQMATEQAIRDADARNAYNAELDRQRRANG